MKKYESYKESGLEHIGKIPINWKVVKLKFIGNAITGITYSPNDVVDKNATSKLVLRSSNIQNGKLALDNNVFIDKEINDKYIAQEGDILICSRNGSRNLIGKNIIIKDELVGETWGAFMTVFRTEHYQFVYYFFNSTIFKSLASLFLSSTINQLTIGVINNFTIAIASPEEQTQIANYLDYKTTIIDALIDKKEQLIKKLQAQRQAIINEAVTKGLDKNAKLKDSGIEWLGEIPEHWEVVKLKQIANAFGRIGYRGYTTSDIVEENEGAITISPSNMKGNFMTFENSTYISWEKYEESPEIKIFNDDVLMVKTGSTYGKVGIVKNLNKKATINPQVLVLKSVKINADYLFNLLRTNYIKYQIETNVIGSTIPTISQTKVLNFSFPLPPNNEIEEIIKFIQLKMNLIDKTQKSVEKVIKKLKSYRQSIISEAVTGKIDVRDWQAPKK